MAGINLSVHGNIRPGDGVLSNFDQSAYAAYNDRHGFDDEGQTSGGMSAGLLFDTRDNGINAQRGWLASAAVRTFFDGFLGGDSTWQQITLDVRNYHKLTADGRQRLGTGLGRGHCPRRPGRGFVVRARPSPAHRDRAIGPGGRGRSTGAGQYRHGFSRFRPHGRHTCRDARHGGPGRLQAPSGLTVAPRGRTPGAARPPAAVRSTL